MKLLQIKIHLNAMRLQFADSTETIDRITSKAAYTLCQDQFNLTVNAVIDHTLKFRTVIHADSTGKIHINISQTPIRQTVNLMRQRRNLHSHTVELRRQAGADASVNAHRFVPHTGKLNFFNPLYLLFRHIDLRSSAYKE